MGLGWICERELREGQGGVSTSPTASYRLHRRSWPAVAPSGRGGADRTIEARVVAILRHLLSTYDDVVCRVHPSARTVVKRSVVARSSGSERIMIRPYPPPAPAEVA